MHFVFHTRLACEQLTKKWPKIEFGSPHFKTEFTYECVVCLNVAFVTNTIPPAKIWNSQFYTISIFNPTIANASKHSKLNRMTKSTTPQQCSGTSSTCNRNDCVLTVSDRLIPLLNGEWKIPNTPFFSCCRKCVFCASVHSHHLWVMYTKEEKFR